MTSFPDFPLFSLVFRLLFHFRLDKLVSLFMVSVEEAENLSGKVGPGQSGFGFWSGHFPKGSRLRPCPRQIGSTLENCLRLLFKFVSLGRFPRQGQFSVRNRSLKHALLASGDVCQLFRAQVRAIILSSARESRVLGWEACIRRRHPTWHAADGGYAPRFWAFFRLKVGSVSTANRPSPPTAANAHR